uniref:Uncharacterized protein n=1 Tax=Vespula pensylvanica TaxID=30213 RepID=A0A834KLV3_VESPE|nr:hypothetical protein H0235_013945 [Vespula pensylvanica]
MHDVVQSGQKIDRVSIVVEVVRLKEDRADPPSRSGYLLAETWKVEVEFLQSTRTNFVGIINRFVVTLARYCANGQNSTLCSLRSPAARDYTGQSNEHGLFHEFVTNKKRACKIYEDNDNDYDDEDDDDDDNNDDDDDDDDDDDFHR